ncbi:MAG: hypothetical protein ACYCZU_11110 [Devosia sp.]
MPVFPTAEPSSTIQTEGKRGSRNFISASIISFSLTFVGVSLAVLAGYLPARQALSTGKLDAEVVLLFVPLCALVFAIVAEVLRIAAKGPLRSTTARRMTPLSDWKPGHGEG